MMKQKFGEEKRRDESEKSEGDCGVIGFGHYTIRLDHAAISQRFIGEIF